MSFQEFKMVRKRRTPLKRVEKITISKRLQLRRIRTAQKILASKGSPITKARARKILGL